MEYYVHPPTRKFGHFEFVASNQSKHMGGSPTIRSSVLDKSIPREIAKYDDSEYREFISCMKEWLFNRPDARRTKKGGEMFCSTPDYFAY